MKTLIAVVFTFSIFLQSCTPSAECIEESSPRKVTIEFLDGKTSQDIFIISSDKDFLYTKNSDEKIEKFHVKKITDQYGRDITQHYLVQDANYLKAKALDNISLTIDKTYLTITAMVTGTLLYLLFDLSRAK